MSIRLRLSLLYTAILALALIVSSLALYLTQAQITLDIAKSTLTRQAELFAKGPGRPPPGETGRSLNGTLPGRWTQVRNLDGTIIGRTADLTDTTLPISASGLLALQGGASWFELAQLDGEPLLIYSQPLHKPDGSTGIVQVASPVAERQQSLDNLRTLLLLGSGLVIAVAFTLSWIVGGTALNPIKRITQTAQAIGAEHNFARRVEHTGPPDEVGQLATTFNAMLTELETNYRHLEQTLDSQRRFVADASHELRTPLTTVRGNIELLRRDPPIDMAERGEILVDTKDEVDRLIRLVNQMLILARADAGRPLRREALPLKPMIEDACRQAKQIAPDRRITCDSAPIAALGDRDALKQVLLVLLDNAIEHTPQQAAIDVTAAAKDSRAIITVRDSGAGIPRASLPHIFERFYRGDGARSSGGTGLGLAIAKELVEGQQGTLTVTSEVGKGTEFVVSLPKG